MRYAIGLVIGVTAVILLQAVVGPYLRWQFSRGDVR